MPRLAFCKWLEESFPVWLPQVSCRNRSGGGCSKAYYPAFLVLTTCCTEALKSQFLTTTTWPDPVANAGSSSKFIYQQCLTLGVTHSSLKYSFLGLRTVEPNGFLTTFLESWSQFPSLPEFYLLGHLLPNILPSQLLSTRFHPISKL